MDFANTPVKVFISYSHRDEKDVKQLKSFLDPLVSQALINIWYDRDIEVGSFWNQEIQDHIESTDIVLYCVSASFCSSKACNAELIKGVKLSQTKSTQVIPIILSECGWKDIKVLSEMQAVPVDGRPLSSFERREEGLKNVYDAIKKCAELIHKRRNLQFSEEFKFKLNDIGALSALNFENSTSIKLSDIFVYPDLHNETTLTEKQQILSSKDIVNEIEEEYKIVIEGDFQSGKTALCKKLVVDLFEKDFIPVLFSEKNSYEGNIRNHVKKLLKLQYTDIECIDKNNRDIVLILDDFHKVVNQQDTLDALSEFRRIIVIVDDVYNLNLKNNPFLRAYKIYRIEPFSAVKRGDLIEKWIRIQERISGRSDENFEIYDRLTRNVDQTLGKVLGRGIIPSYPFYVLSILVTVEAAGRPLDSEITSQGYCYQVLLLLSLKKAGVKGNRLDTYLNLLTELGYFHFSKGHELNSEELGEFLKSYRKNYVLNETDDRVIQYLAVAGVYAKKSTGFYAFTQRYLQYYFCAKYISEYIQVSAKCKQDYNQILSNLGNSSNAYIAVFIAHHSRNLFHLAELKKLINEQFSRLQPCYLRKTDVDKLNYQIRRIAQVAFPMSNALPSEVRRNELVRRFDEENNIKEDISDESAEIRELIVAIRGTEVVGQIIKCRAGSISKEELTNLIRAIIQAYGRIVASFLKTFEGSVAEDEIIAWLTMKLQSKIGRGKANCREIAENLFWQINYFTILGLVYRCIQTVGSDLLLAEIQSVCQKEEGPFPRLVLIGVQMWFYKQIDKSALVQVNSQLGGITKWVLQKLVVRYCMTHKVDYKLKQQLGALLSIQMPVQLL